MKKNILIQIIFIFILTGCDPVDSITLINDTTGIINVTIKSTVSLSEEAFVLQPQEKKPVVIFGLMHTNNPEKMKAIINRIELVKSVQINDKIFSVEEIKQIMTENMKLEDKRWIIHMSCFSK
ncbi:MAG: hypothetical protein JW982_12810 [Spirochaetes bacterium]|nr:hypothetical protein [Spirochaetota bacterium]